MLKDRRCFRCKYWAPCQQHGERLIGILFRRKGVRIHTRFVQTGGSDIDGVPIVRAYKELLVELPCMIGMPEPKTLTEMFKIFNLNHRRWGI